LPEIVGQRAIVIGAGIAGLTAARALSGSFAQVVILERDKLGPEAAPRTGVPQGKQPHALLVGGQRALSDQFPRFVEQLLKSGAVAYDYTMARLEMGGVDPLPQRDLGIPIYSASRPLIEHVIRHELKQIPNVTLQEQTRVEALTLSDSGVINGARYAAPGGAVDSVSADLIIDASGRGAPTMKLLAATGCARPETSSIGINIDYSTAIFAKPKDAPADWLLLATLPKAPQERRGGVIMPIEGNQWMVTLTSRHPQSPPPARHTACRTDYAYCAASIYRKRACPLGAAQYPSARIIAARRCSMSLQSPLWARYERGRTTSTRIKAIIKYGGE
jgi:2-polyprenyl-6-methoxyphenol hydroxylase-like FAD-dependent oxidoreductase